MGKNKKTVDNQKKKDEGVSGSAIGKFKKNGNQKKKQQNNKHKKAGAGNISVKPTVLTEKDESVSRAIELETKQKTPKEAKKKDKRVVVDESIADNILSNPKIGKKKSEKKVAHANGELGKAKKNENIVVYPSEEQNAAQEEQTKSKKKKKFSIPDEKNGVEIVAAISDKKRKKSKSKDDQEEGASPKKIKQAKLRENQENEHQLNTSPKKETKENNQKSDASPKKIKKKKSKEAKTGEGSDKTKEEIAEEKQPRISVFVGNLPVNTKRGKILKIFSKFGKIQSIRFRLSNGVKFFKSQSKVTSPNVIAFVDFKSEEDAKSSLVMNGEKINGNVIRVNMQSNAKRADGFDGKRTVFVGNLKFSVTDQNLYDLFSCCGDIEYARTMQCDKGCSGVAYVCFKKSESVGMALELNNSDLQGRPIRVQRYAKPAPGGPKEKKNKMEKPTGALRRLGTKKQKVKTFKKGQEPSSKTEFAGVKAKDKKGFVKKNKKKPLKGPKLLAKKIASRDKTTAAA